MVNINRISYKIEKGTRSFLSHMRKGDALLPIILLEAAVTGGRTYHAFKRGGFIEGRERGTEEVLGAVFWLGGVQAFNKIGDVIGKKLLGLKNVDFEVGKDAVRNPLKNYMHEVGKNAGKISGKLPRYSEKTLATFKFTKVVSSILLANAVIGFVVPKMNQAITRRYQKSIEQTKQPKNQTDKNQDINKFIDKSSRADKKTSFGMNVQGLLSLANNFENDARYKLLSTDVGIAGGRAINARNQPERREILFRDLSSIYFYMFSKGHIESFLNLIEDGRTTRLDPQITQKLNSYLCTQVGQEQYTVEQFKDLVLGKKAGDSVDIPGKIKAAIKNDIITLDEFKSVEKNAEVIKRATLMSNLQPKVADVSILTSEQVKDVYRNGLLDDPTFLNKVFRTHTAKSSTNPFKFVAEKDLRTLKGQMTVYVEDIIKKAKNKGEMITIDTLKSANRNNFIKNSFNISVGFAISAYFLSTAIPKIQYWMTRMQTGQDKFPGVEHYKDKKNK